MYLRSGTLLHKRYRILRIIIVDGWADVYVAEDVERHAVCAIKELRIRPITTLQPIDRARLIQRFLGEVRISSRLKHPNLPTFIDFFTERSRYFLVTEYVEGSTLEELLWRNGGPFSEGTVLGWARQLCDVLEYLHNHQPPVIFCDVMPGNVMLMSDGRIKLVDFFAAQLFRPTVPDHLSLGTPGFASPELYDGRQRDKRSDIYSLAITLFHLMTDTFSENGFGLKDVHAINPSISPVVAQALEKATALAPEDRYDDIATFRRSLLGMGESVSEHGEDATP